MDPNTTSNRNPELCGFSPPATLLEQCPRFNILVLGSPEMTKLEIFSRLFGVTLDKITVQNAFISSHDIDVELDLAGQNDRVAIYTSRNFGAGDERTYRAVADFVRRRRQASPDLASHIHCIWYCVASDESRPIDPLEARFFRALNNDGDRDGDRDGGVDAPVVIVFTKYDEFVAWVRRRWERDCQERGLSSAAVLHVLRDLTASRFQETIGSRWDRVVGGGEEGGDGRRAAAAAVTATAGHKKQTVLRERVTGDDDGSFERLAAATLASVRVRDRSARLAFVAAQRNSAWMASQFCANIASEYFIVDTGHARKVDGVEMGDILADFFAKCLLLFNLRCGPEPESESRSTTAADALHDPTLPARVLEAVFDPAKLPFLELAADPSSSSAGAATLASGLSPHERACLLAQALAATLWFFHRVADAQWIPRRRSDAEGEAETETSRVASSFLTAPAVPTVATRRVIDRALDDVRRAKRERADVLETVEASAVFTRCRLRSEVADLVLRAIERAESVSSISSAGSSRTAATTASSASASASAAGRSNNGDRGPPMIVDDWELEHLSLSPVNHRRSSKGADDVFLPSGMRILPLN